MLETLDTFIGLFTIYLILSLIVTAIGNGITSLFNFKPHTMELILGNLLGEDLKQAVLEHSSIQKLSQPRKSRWLSKLFRDRVTPSYIPGEQLVEALLDLIVNKRWELIEGKPKVVSGDEKSDRNLRRRNATCPWCAARILLNQVRL